MKKTCALVAALALLVVCTGCPQKNLSAKKAAVFDIQKTIDVSADTLASLSASGIISKQDAGEIAKLLLPVNNANRALIDAAWNNDPTISSKLAALDAAINAFVSSGVVVKNRESQSAIQKIVETLLKDIQVLKGK